MKWKEITIYTTEEGTEIILARLDMLGITQVNIVQGDEEIDALLHSCEKYWDYADEAAMGKQPSVQAYVSDVPEMPQWSRRCEIRLRNWTVCAAKSALIWVR